jgi:hypothetical protein
VHGSERVTAFERDREHLGGAERAAAADALIEGLPVQALHHQVARAVRQVAVLVHLDHVLVPGQAERCGFAAQAVGGERVVRHRCAE